MFKKIIKLRYMIVKNIVKLIYRSKNLTVVAELKNTFVVNDNCNLIHLVGKSSSVDSHYQLHCNNEVLKLKYFIL